MNKETRDLAEAILEENFLEADSIFQDLMESKAYYNLIKVLGGTVGALSAGLGANALTPNIPTSQIYDLVSNVDPMHLAAAGTAALGAAAAGKVADHANYFMNRIRRGR